MRLEFLVYFTQRDGRLGILLQFDVPQLPRRLTVVKGGNTIATPGPDKIVENRRAKRYIDLKELN